MYGEYHVLSTLLLLKGLIIYNKPHVHTPVVIQEVAGLRDICQAVLSHISEWCLATALGVSSSITTGHDVLKKMKFGRVVRNESTIKNHDWPSWEKRCFVHQGRSNKVVVEKSRENGKMYLTEENIFIQERPVLSYFVWS